CIALHVLVFFLIVYFYIFDVCISLCPPLFPYTTLFRSWAATWGWWVMHRTCACSPSSRSRCPTISATPPPTPTSTSSNTRLGTRSEEHTSELQSRFDLVCRLRIYKKKNRNQTL